MTPFAELDAERNRYLEEAMRREDAGRRRIKKTCAFCGGGFGCRNAARETCSSDCQVKLMAKRVAEVAPC